MKNKVLLSLFLLLYLTPIASNAAENMTLYEYNGEIYGLQMEATNEVTLEATNLIFDLNHQPHMTLSYTVQAKASGTYQILMPYALPAQSILASDLMPTIKVNEEEQEGEIVGVGNYLADKDRDQAAIDNQLLQDKIEKIFQGQYEVLNTDDRLKAYNIRGLLSTLKLESGETTISVEQNLYPYTSAEITDRWIDRYRVHKPNFKALDPLQGTMTIKVIPNWEAEFGKPYLVESTLDFIEAEGVYTCSMNQFDQETFSFAMYDQETVHYTRQDDEGNPVSKTQDQTLMWIVTLLVSGIFIVLLVIMTLFIILFLIRLVIKKIKKPENKDR